MNSIETAIATQRTNPVLKDYHDAPIMMGQGKLQPGEKYRWTPTGLIFSPDFRPPLEEFDEIGGRIIGLAVASKFAFADWYIHGETVYGEEFFQCSALEKAKEAGFGSIADGTLEQIISTAKRLPPAERIVDDPDVTFSHNREIANVKDPKKRREISHRVRSEHPTVTGLRGEVKRANRKPDSKPISVEEPFKYTVSFRAANPGEDKRAWYLACRQKCLEQIEVALEKHLKPREKAATVQEAKRVSRTEAKKGNGKAGKAFVGPIPKPKDVKTKKKGRR